MRHLARTLVVTAAIATLALASGAQAVSTAQLTVHNTLQMQVMLTVTGTHSVDWLDQTSPGNPAPHGLHYQALAPGHTATVVMKARTTGGGAFDLHAYKWPAGAGSLHALIGSVHFRCANGNGWNNCGPTAWTGTDLPMYVPAHAAAGAPVIRVDRIGGWRSHTVHPAVVTIAAR